MNQPNSIPPAILLMGPTASGKTDLALQLADQFPLEIISVDSALIYREMNIGTAKPPKILLDRVPHHLIDIRDPSQSYSCAEFRQDALACMEAIVRRGKIPLLVGGTMLYFRALQYGIHDIPKPAPGVREKIMAEAQTKGIHLLHQRLGELDPDAASRIHPNDPQRIIRALEVFETTGRPLSTFWRQSPPQAPWRWHAFILAHFDKEYRNSLIERRFKTMLEQGLIEEVTALHQRADLNPSLPSMRTVGYRQVWAYLDGHWDYDTMRYKAVVATRQLAKRQMTWLRSRHDGQWLKADHSETYSELSRMIENIGFS